MSKQNTTSGYIKGSEIVTIQAKQKVQKDLDKTLQFTPSPENTSDNFTIIWNALWRHPLTTNGKFLKILRKMTNGMQSNLLKREHHTYSWDFART